MDRQLSDRFVGALNEIQDLLEKSNPEASNLPFDRLIDLAAASDPVIGNFSGELHRYRRLRNALLHEQRGKPLAEPYPEVVQRLENMRDKIAQPVLVLPTLGGAVFKCDPDQRIGLAAATMAERNFSALPVYEAGSLIGLLTTTAIARWLGSSFGEGMDIVEEVPIRRVLGYEEDRDNYRLLGRNATVSQAIGRFAQFEREGRVLGAIILTDRGDTSEPALGILTVADMPRLWKLAGT